MPDSCANAFFPTIALLNWTGNPVALETIFDALLINSVLIPVSYGIKSFLVLIAITISSKAAFPALSPIPLIVHSICLTPADKPAKAFATANPRSLWQWAEIIALSIFGTLFLICVMVLANSSGIEYPTVSGILMVFAPHLIASSIVLHMKSRFVLVPSSQDHSTSSVNFLA